MCKEKAVNGKCNTDEQRMNHDDGPNISNNNLGEVVHSRIR